LPTDQEQVLFSAVSEIEVFGSLDPMIVRDSRDRWVAGLRTTGVLYRPEVWFGLLSVARRQAYSRAVRRLCRRGFVERVTERCRDRVTHLRPTLAALRYVQARTNGSLNAAVLLEGLRRCRWADDLREQFAALSPATEGSVILAVSPSSQRPGMADRRRGADDDDGSTFDFVLGPIEV
jgi:hypothetical protein